MQTTTDHDTPDAGFLRRNIVPIVIVAGLLFGVGLSLTQPWKHFIDDVVAEEFSVAIGEATPDPVPTEDGAAAVSGPAPEVSDPAAPTGPVLLASGQFQDRSHPTSGSVAFFELEDGSRVLRIEGLESDNGPDLFVYLDTDDADAPSGSYDDGVNLGRLKGNIGDQTYEIPADVDLDDFTTVIIWCDRFSVTFGTAGLS